ncbi:hypothetical protein GXY_15302 [Novacetimonas hansenii ATCC 23769]|uniref:Uncharacterized protein n=1 Tax=Novacetimonas hansenii ATCC 23769 TaxID=714995 RepID=D5QIS9_NOVHA|nr:hypothetical protein GXY_15302 [Novacetimonas hansenii ATCC 23769]
MFHFRNNVISIKSPAQASHPVLPAFVEDVRPICRAANPVNSESSLPS